MSRLLLYLLFFPPGVFLVLALLSVATGLACARWMPGVSRISGLLTAFAVCVVLGALMFFRVDALDWVGARLGVDLPKVFIGLLTVAIYVAGIGATWGICRLRRAAM